VLRIASAARGMGRHPADLQLHVDRDDLQSVIRKHHQGVIQRRVVDPHLVVADRLEHQGHLLGARKEAKGEISSDKIGESFKSTLQELRAYFREMNVNEQLADAMLRIDPEHTRVLNYTELNHFGLTEIDPIATELEELRAAKNLGISRHEYMRRKALAQGRCFSPSTFCAQKIMQTGKVDPSAADQEDPNQYGDDIK
jgi:hypothetical protein